MARPFSLVVAGYGIEARPKLPVAIAQLEDSSLVFGPLDPALRTAAPKNVLIKPGSPPKGAFERHHHGIVTYSTGERGSTQLVLGVDMESYDDVLDEVRVADHRAQWTIITDDHTARWPARAALFAHGSLDHGSPYQLSLGEGKLVTPIGPFTPDTLPTPEKLIIAGQTFVQQLELQGATDAVVAIELAYEHASIAWLQRYYYVPCRPAVYMIQARAPRDAARGVFDAADVVATSLRPS